MVLQTPGKRLVFALRRFFDQAERLVVRQVEARCSADHGWRAPVRPHLLTDELIR